MKIITLRIFLIFSLIYSGFSVSGQQRDQNKSEAFNFLKNRNEVYFSLSRDKGINISDLSDKISIDRISSDSIFAYANTDMFTEFLKTGITYKTLPPPSVSSNSKMSNTCNAMSDWDSYPTYDVYIELMNQFANTYPDICTLEKIGESIEGRDILVVKISDNVTVKESESEFLYTSTMHGDELTGMILSLRLIDNLLSLYGSDQRITDLVNNLEIWINPLSNPDGTYFSGNNTVVGATRFNAAGVDLNRNFPDPENGLHPDGYPWQAETVVMMEFLSAHNFVLSANFHTGYEVINYPWDTWPTYHADDLWYEQISREYADTVHTFASSLGNYLVGQNNGITNGYEWYTTNGCRQDYMNYFHNSREVTMELSLIKTPAANLLPAYWNANYRSLYGYMEQCYSGIHGIVIDTINESPLRAKIEILNHDFNNSEIYSNNLDGYYNRLISPGIYDVKITAPGYIDKVKTNIQLDNNSSYELDVKLLHSSLGIENYNVFEQNSFAFPNPFQSDLSVFFTLKSSENLSISVYNTSGNKIFSMDNKQYSEGLNEVEINLDYVSSGTYFLELNSSLNNVRLKVIKID